MSQAEASQIDNPQFKPHIVTYTLFDFANLFTNRAQASLSVKQRTEGATLEDVNKAIPPEDKLLLYTLNYIEGALREKNWKRYEVGTGLLSAAFARYGERQDIAVAEMIAAYSKGMTVAETFVRNGMPFEAIEFYTCINYVNTDSTTHTE